ncbi:hypothetical protein HDU67_005605, partial [Dinochytrium kinnereticum]
MASLYKASSSSSSGVSSKAQLTHGDGGGSYSASQLERSDGSDRTESRQSERALDAARPPQTGSKTYNHAYPPPLKKRPFAVGGKGPAATAILTQSLNLAMATSLNDLSGENTCMPRARLPGSSNSLRPSSSASKPSPTHPNSTNLVKSSLNPLQSKAKTNPTPKKPNPNRSRQSGSHQASPDDPFVLQHKNLEAEIHHQEDARDKVLMAIIQSLLEMENRPSTPRELTACIMKHGFAHLGGLTPHATVSSRISTHFKRCSLAEAAGEERQVLLGRRTYGDGNNPRKLRYFIEQLPTLEDEETRVPIP